MIQYEEIFSNMNKRDFQEKLGKDFAGSVLRILLPSIKSPESHQVHASSRLHEQPQASDPKVSQEEVGGLYTRS